jgi:DnaA family protein
MASGGSAAWITEGATALSARHLVLCDDVDRLDPAAQLLAFEMADEAGRHGARILTSAPHPAHALTLRDDLRTRLAQSLSISLTPRSEEDKRAALTAHATQRGFRLGPEIIDYMITRVRRDMGTLMGVLEALDRYSLSSKRPLTLPLAREVLQRSQF